MIPEKLIEKVPPQNAEAETAVLASMLLDREAIPSSTAVIKVVPLKIEYSESALMLEGYSRKQVWEP